MSRTWSWSAPVQQPSRKVAAVRAAWDAGLLPKVIEPEVIDAELVPEPEPKTNVVGIDGKRYTRPPVDVPAPKPRRWPLPDAFREAVSAAQKDVGRLRRLVADDRFAANRESLAGNRYDLARTLEVLHEVHDAVTGSTIASDIVEALQATPAKGGNFQLALDAITPHNLISTAAGQMAEVDLSEIDDLQRRIDDLAETEASIRGLRTALQHELCRDTRRRVQELGRTP
jgi:hypothetical protein